MTKDTHNEWFTESTYLPEASNGQRLVNYLVDTIFMRVVLLRLIFDVLESHEVEHWVTWLITGISIYLLYYTSSELLLKGRTLGKLIT